MEEEKKTTTQQDFSQLNKLRGTTKSATTDEETVVSHLFTGMAAMYKQLQSHSEGRNALYSFLFFFFFKTQLLAFTEVAMALTEPVRNQKGGQEHQRQLINLG